jgi:hypothetical protein
VISDEVKSDATKLGYADVELNLLVGHPAETVHLRRPFAQRVLVMIDVARQ